MRPIGWGAVEDALEDCRGAGAVAGVERLVGARVHSVDRVWGGPGFVRGERAARVDIVEVFEQSVRGFGGERLERVVAGAEARERRLDERAELGAAEVRDLVDLRC